MPISRLPGRARVAAITTGAVVVALAGLGLAAPADAAPASAATAPAIPLPHDDPFYAVPADAASSAPGTVLNSRQVTLSPLTELGHGAAYQLQFRTTDQDGSATAAVETVVTSAFPWNGPGPRPILEILPAYDAHGDQCDPSYTLRTAVLPSVAGIPDTLAFAQGWDIAFVDYEGVDVQSLAPRLMADASLDAARATASFAPIGASAASPIAISGYSGGGYASALAAQAQPSYAPELNLVEVAMGGVPADWNVALGNLSGGPFSALIPFFISGLAKAHPEAHLEQYVSPAVWADVQADDDVCIDGATTPQFTSIQQMEAYPGSLTSGPFAALVASVSAVDLPGTPTAPIYDYHATGDEIAPIAGDRALMHRYCTAGATVDYTEVLGEHLTGAVTGYPGQLLALQQAFAGAAPVDDCAGIPAG
jgi:hypothetical protein